MSPSKLKMGVFSTLDALLFGQVLVYYIKKQSANSSRFIAPNLNVLNITLTLVVIFVAATLLIHWMFPTLRKRIVTFWVVTGFIAVCAWNLFVFIGGFFDEMLAKGPAITAAQTFADFQGLASFIIIVLLNVLFGGVIKLVRHFAAARN